MAYDYQLIDVAITGGIATVTINNPPINIITPKMVLCLLVAAHFKSAHQCGSHPI